MKTLFKQNDVGSLSVSGVARDIFLKRMVFWVNEHDLNSKHPSSLFGCATSFLCDHIASHLASIFNIRKMRELMFLSQ